MASSPPQKPGDNSAAIAGVEDEIGQIARGAGVGLSGNAINYAVSYLFGILVARQIGADEFGLYTLGVTAVTLISRFTIIGLDRGLMRDASILRGQGQGAALRWLTFVALTAGTIASAIGGFLVWAFPTQILNLFNWGDNTGLLALLPVLAFAIPALTITGIGMAGTQAFRTMRYRALVVNTIQPLVRLFVALGLIGVLGATAMAPVLGFVVAQILGAALTLVIVSRLVRRVPAGTGHGVADGRTLFRFSLPLMLASVLDYLNGRTEILVIGMFLVSGAAGIYNAASRLSGLGLIVLTAFNAIFAPVISDLHHRHRHESLGILFKLVTRWIVAFAMPLILVQLLYAPQFMSLFGPEFVSGATALRILSVGQLVNFATGSVGLMLVMAGRSDIGFINSVITVALALVLDFWLVPAYGLNGAAVAGALIIILTNSLRVGQVWWLMRLHPFSLGFLKPFVAAVPATLVGWAWLHWLPLNSLLYFLAACVAVGVVYLAALLAQGLDEGDRMLLAALYKRVAAIGRRRRPAKPD